MQFSVSIGHINPPLEYISLLTGLFRAAAPERINRGKLGQMTVVVIP